MRGYKTFAFYVPNSLLFTTWFLFVWVFFSAILLLLFYINLTFPNSVVESYTEISIFCTFAFHFAYFRREHIAIILMTRAKSPC